MEAAGIEPASRDISEEASTCVVDYLGFDDDAANRQATPPPRRERDLTFYVLDMTEGDPELVTEQQLSPAKSGGSGQPFTRQPEPNQYWQLKVIGRLLTWPADQPRHATSTSSYPVESNFAPEVEYPHST